MTSWLDQLGAGIRDDYQLTVLTAYFAPDALYQDGSTFLLNLIGIDENGEPATEKFNAAKVSEWATYDGGKTIVPIGSVKAINKSSMYGHLIESAVNCGAGDILATRGDPTNASAWIGLRFHMKSIQINFGGKLQSVTKNMPDEFLGLDTDAPPVQGSLPLAPQMPPVDLEARRAAILAESQDRAMSAPTVGDAEMATQPPDGLHVKLVELAKSSPDHKSFVQAALYVEGVMSDDELVSSVTDVDGFYKTHH